MMEEALFVQRAIPGPEHVDTATTLCNLGVLLYRTGAYEPSRRRGKRR